MKKMNFNLKILIQSSSAPKSEYLISHIYKHSPHEISCTSNLILAYLA